MVRSAALHLSAALLSGCGGSSVPCARVEVGGMCWVGHACGVPEGDPRLYGEYFLVREAMEGSSWPGCTSADGDGDGR
jgi:hypothetical protein